MNLPRWMRKPTAAELIEDKRIALRDTIDTEMIDLQRSIYQTEKEIAAGQNNLRYQRQRLALLQMQHGSQRADERAFVKYPHIETEPALATAD